MATSTNKYSLTKPDLSEKVKVEVINANMDVIDSTMSDLQNQATANKSKTDANALNLSNHINNANNPHGVTKEQLGLGSVENKSSATIRGELTKNNVTNALGYTPYTPNEIDNKLSALETNIDWKEAVATFDAIATTYPNPQDGWTVNINDTDITYRFDGEKWIPISANAIPKATDSVDGLLSKEDHLKYEDANSKKHVHSNKSVLDKITQSLSDNWNNAYTHISDTIKHISSTERTNWTDAYNKRHIHDNKSILDGITSALISAWDSAVEHITDTVKHVTNAERTLWNTIVDKVDKADGKGLSTNDYTTAEKEKLQDIAAGAEVNVQSDWNVTDTASDAYIKNKPTSMSASDVYEWAKAERKPSYSKAEVGLGNVENKSSDTIRSELTRENVTDALGYTPPETNTVYTHPSTSGNKHIPSGGSAGQILRWLEDGTAEWDDDNNTTYDNFVKSGSGAKAGLVPAPPTTAGISRYLREDGIWETPPDTNTQAVTSVNEKMGEVVLSATDIGAVAESNIITSKEQLYEDDNVSSIANAIVLKAVIDELWEKTVTEIGNSSTGNTGGFSFGYDEDGNPGYIVPGGSEVIPFGTAKGEISYDCISWEKVEDGECGFIQKESQYESVVGEENKLGTFTGYSKYVINNPLTSYIKYSFNYILMCNLKNGSNYSTIIFKTDLNDEEILNETFKGGNGSGSGYSSDLKTCSFILKPGINTIKLYHTLKKSSSLDSTTINVTLPNIVLNEINTYYYVYWEKISDSQGGKSFIEEEDGIWWARGSQWNAEDSFYSTFEITVPEDISTDILILYNCVRRDSNKVSLPLFSASLDGINFFKTLTATSSSSSYDKPYSKTFTASLSKGTHILTIEYNIVPASTKDNEYINVALSPILFSNN